MRDSWVKDAWWRWRTATLSDHKLPDPVLSNKNPRLFCMNVMLLDLLLHLYKTMKQIKSTVNTEILFLSFAHHRLLQTRGNPKSFRWSRRRCFNIVFFLKYCVTWYASIAIICAQTLNLSKIWQNARSMLYTVLSSSVTVSSFLLSLGKLAFLKHKDTYYIWFANTNEQMRG